MTLFRLPILVSIAAVLTTLLLWGVSAAITVCILAVLEVSLSFDNAVVNAKILGKMSPKWQRLFLTVGILIAVFGMRLVLPLIVVALSAHINPLTALDMALTSPHEYAHHLEHAHPLIAAFGGMFLLMLFLNWLGEEREFNWIPLEKHFKDISSRMILGIALITIGVATSVFGGNGATLFAGILGILIYIAVDSLDELFNTESGIARAGLGTFIYLEILDASFSFDGVIGAFAITSRIFLIAMGLGIGALFVRGLTVMLVRKGTLSEYVFLEHGAHWAIAILSILLLASIKFAIPEVVTGLLGVGLIGAALISSLRYKNSHS